MIWNDIAEWRGPTVNRVTAGMVEWRGLVVHIAEGSYEGTIAWQKNPAASVSSHFVCDTDGTLAQVVDTADTAWTQIAGNGHWLSVECAGFTPNPLTPQQVQALSVLLRRCHHAYGVPYAVATDPTMRGLGHHSMGTNGHSVPTDTWTGPTWGHTDCPGPAIVAQKQSIVDLARGFDMPKFVRVRTTGAVWLTNGPDRYHIPDPGAYTAALALWGQTTADVVDIDEAQLPAYGQDVAARSVAVPHTHTATLSGPVAGG